jgi:hypothetical protein
MKSVKPTKQIKIDTLLYALNKDRNDGKNVSFTNLSKAKISDIDNLYIKYNINFEEEYEAYKIKEIKAAKLRLDNKRMEDEISKMRDEDYSSNLHRQYETYNELPKGVKTICEKVKQYTDYQKKLKNIHDKKQQAMSLLKTSDINDERIIVKDGDVTCVYEGITVYISSNGFMFSLYIYQYQIIKELINDYKKGDLTFEMTVKKRIKLRKAIK